MTGLRRLRQLLRDRPESSRHQSEVTLSRYFEQYVARGSPGLRHVVRHPHQTLVALAALSRIPRLTAELSDSVEAAVIRRFIARPPAIGRTAIRRVAAVLVLPDQASDYSLGHSKQTLRRKVRAAQKLGVRWARVDSYDERRRLLDLAEQHERNHPLAEHRQTNPANTDLFEYRLWLAAYSADGRPLLLSVTPVDGEWALLRYFRILHVGKEYSNARYFMTQVLVEQLATMGVRYLADSGAPAGLPNGLRHYQRILGFRIFRVRLRDSKS
jgi:hypothetical protein